MEEFKQLPWLEGERGEKKEKKKRKTENIRTANVGGVVG
jgi:hypothetical protein